MSRLAMKRGAVLSVVALVLACTARNPAFREPRPAAIEEDAQAPAVPADAALPPPADAAAPDFLPADAAAPEATPPDAAGPDLAADAGPADAPRDTAPDAGADLSPVHGLTGRYFDGHQFNTLKFTRTDPVLDFAWANDPPDPSLPFEGFTVRWTGQLRTLYSETYTFTVHSSDGSRVWIDGKLVIDDWRLHAPEDYSGQLALTGNQLHDIKVEYLHSTGWAVVRIFWESPSQKRGVIPTDALFPE
jgi:hypothetical protein